jgi:hypothetical protein
MDTKELATKILYDIMIGLNVHNIVISKRDLLIDGIITQIEHNWDGRVSSAVDEQVSKPGLGVNCGPKNLGGDFK